jgi:hypothetical protein
MTEPKDPNADHANEHDSIRSYRQATALMREYLDRVTVTSEGVEVAGRIRLGTPSSPHVRAPIHIPLSDVQGLLLDTASLIDNIVRACRETISSTMNEATNLEQELPEDARRKLKSAVEERASELGALCRELQVDEGHQPPYHPARLQRCREAMESNLGTGDPRIKVEYTVTRVL